MKKKLLAVLLTLTMVMSLMPVTAMAEGPVVVETAEEAQAALDKGVAGTTIQLQPNVNYGTLLIRQNASSTVVDITDIGGDYRGNEHYSKYENITILGAAGATVDQIAFQTGRLPDSAIWSYVDVKNLTISGVTFSGEKTAINFDTTGSYLGVDGVKIVNCKMNDADGSDRFVYQNQIGYTTLTDKSTQENVMIAGVKNLSITGCEVTGAHQVIEARPMENLTIKQNTFSGIKSRDILLAANTGSYSGTITIEENTSKNGEERFIRATSIGNATLIIRNNTITNYKGEDSDFIKADGVTGTCTITNNTLDGAACAVKSAGVVHTVSKAVAQIGTTPYATLADAIEAADPGDTIELYAGTYAAITLNEAVNIKGAGVGKTIINADSNNRSITYTAYGDGQGKALTVEGVTLNGVIKYYGAGNESQNNTYNLEHSLANYKLYVKNCAFTESVSDLCIQVDSWTKDCELYVQNTKFTSAKCCVSMHDDGPQSATEDGKKSFTTFALRNKLCEFDATADSSFAYAVQGYFKYYPTGWSNASWVQGFYANANDYFTDRKSPDFSQMADNYDTCNVNSYAHATSKTNADVWPAEAKIGNKFYATLAAALNAAQSGEIVTLLKSSAEACDVTLAADKSITIEGSNATKLTGGLTLRSGNEVTVKDIAFETKGLAVVGAANATIEGNIFTNITEKAAGSVCPDAIFVDAPKTKTVIKNNEINHAEECGIYVRTAAGTTEITGNEIVGVYDNAIQLVDNSTGNMTITGNTLTNWANDGGIDGTPHDGRALRIRSGEITEAATITFTGNKMSVSNTHSDDEFVKIDGIDGDNIDEQYTIDLRLNYWGSASPDFTKIVLTKGVTATTAPYYKAAAMGTTDRSDYVAPSYDGGGSSTTTPSQPTTSTETKPDGSTTTTETKPDGTVTESNTSKPTTDASGNTSQTTTETTTGKDGVTESKTETVTKPDGSASSTTESTTTKPDGTKTESTTETTINKDGSTASTTTETTTNKDGTVTESKTEATTSTVTNKDGSTTETKQETTTTSTGSKTESTTVTTVNKDGSSTATTTATTTDKAGTVTASKTESTTNKNGTTTEKTTTTETKANGTVTESKTETTINKDGSSKATTTETVTKADGTKVESKTTATTSLSTNKSTGTVTETKKETTTTSDGVKSEGTTVTQIQKDGTVTSKETVKASDSTGTTATKTTTLDAKGNVTTAAEAAVSAKAVTEAAKTGAAVTIPVEVAATKSASSAPTVSVSVPKTAESVKVELPVQNVTPGTVAVIVNADGTEKIVSTSMVTENGVALTLDGSATVKLVDNSKSFKDVPNTNVFYNEISSLSAREIMIGKTGDKFDLHNSVTLNQTANVAGRITGAVDVSDFNAGVAWGQANGLKIGNVAATRGDVLKALYIAAGSPAVEDTTILSRFKDSASIPADMTAIAAWAAQNGILKGNTDGTAGLGKYVSRGQACALAGRTMGTLA